MERNRIQDHQGGIQDASKGNNGRKELETLRETCLPENASNDPC